MINVQFSARDERWDSYQAPLSKACKNLGLQIDLRRNFEDPSIVDYIVFAPNGPLEDFRPYTNVKAVLSLWAGVEQLIKNTTLNSPTTRMVDDGLREGMVEWVAGHVLRHHLGMDAQIATQDGSWSPLVPPLARNRRVTILGLGALGQACAQALRTLNFQVSGWSRRQKDIEGLVCYAGQSGLSDALSTAEILVLLLPQTPQTENLLNAQTLAALPHGAVILNPGRGPLIDDSDLLEALETGHIAQATLDVFRQEPLPVDHPYWAHPNVTVTPHIASETRPETASQRIAENIFRNENGKDLLNLVDPKSGY
ncbi:MAG: glyoxylate/hydroxypyruvate reductase A [Pseudoruegeria sp.]